jgi:hypothetical protein
MNNGLLLLLSRMGKGGAEGRPEMAGLFEIPSGVAYGWKLVQHEIVAAHCTQK